MPPDRVREAEEQYLASLTGDGEPDPGWRASINFPDRAYRPFREHPLLVIHLLKIIPPGNTEFEESNPVGAYSISFPRTEQEEKRVEYVVNTTWMREHYADETGSEELDDDGD
jgi:hypothetical protein